MRFIINTMDYIVDGILDAWDNTKEAIIELSELGVGIVNAIVVLVFLLSIPVWIIPYLIYRYRNNREV